MNRKQQMIEFVSSLDGGDLVILDQLIKEFTSDPKNSNCAHFNYRVEFYLNETKDPFNIIALNRV